MKNPIWIWLKNFILALIVIAGLKFYFEPGVEWYRILTGYVAYFVLGFKWNWN